MSNFQVGDKVYFLSSYEFNIGEVNVINSEYIFVKLLDPLSSIYYPYRDTIAFDINNNNHRLRLVRKSPEYFKEL